MDMFAFMFYRYQYRVHVSPFDGQTPFNQPLNSSPSEAGRSHYQRSVNITMTLPEILGKLARLLVLQYKAGGEAH